MTMAMAPGFGTLHSARDLLEKLRHDYARIEHDPTDQYAAFDFFVTAEHVLDWHLPGAANRAAREQMRKSNVLLEITSHIASGSKHFVAEARHHRSVSHVDAPPPAFHPHAFQGDAFQTGELIVTLDGKAAVELGAAVRVQPLARKVVDFWAARL
jgi:hypothetical protein